MGSITVNWNNLMPPFSTELYRPYDSSRTSLQDVEENVVRQTWLVAGGDYGSTTRLKTVNFNIIKDHKYYCSYMINSNFNFFVGVEFCGGVIPTPIETGINTWIRFSAIGTAIKNGDFPIYFGNLRDGGPITINQSCILLKSPIYIDLTQMFGAGKQPNLQQFEAQCQLNGIDLTQSHEQDLNTPKNWIIPNYSIQMMQRKASVMTSAIKVFNSFAIEQTNAYTSCNTNSYSPGDTLTITPVAGDTQSAVQHYKNGYVALFTPNLVDDLDYTFTADAVISDNPLNSNSISIAPYGVGANATYGAIEDGKIKLTFNFVAKSGASTKYIELRTGGKTLSLTNIKIWTNLYEQTFSANTLPFTYQRVDYLFRTNEWAGPYSAVNLPLKAGDTITFIVKGINVSGQQAFAGNNVSGANFEFYYQNNTGKLTCYPSSTRLKDIRISQSNSTSEPDVIVGKALIDETLIYLGVYRTDKYYFNGRIYGCKIRNVNGKLKHNFIPCYRKLDNVPGFYDLKTNMFYINEVTTGEWQLPSSTN